MLVLCQSVRVTFHHRLSFGPLLHKRFSTMSFQPNGVEFLDVSIEADFNKPHSPRINLKDMNKMSNGGKDEANQSTKKELSAITKICMIAKLQCIFLPMKLFGLYYQDVRGTCSGEFVAYGGKSAFLMRSYQFVVIAILWMNFGKTLASFWVGNDLGTMILPAFLWLLQTALQASICFFTMNLRSKKSALKSLLLYWNSQPNFHELVVESYMIKCVKRTTMVAYLLMVMNTVLYGLILFSSESLIPVAQAMVSPLPVTSTVAKVFFFIVAIYSSAAWLMPFAIFSAVCLTLIHQCRRLRKTLRLTASASEVRRVKILRGQHSSLCGSVRKVDNLFKFLTLVVYVTNIPLLCFLFYNLIFVKTDNVLTKVTLSFWFVIVACIMIGVSFLGAQLNSWIHSFTEVVQKVQISNVDLDTHTELMLFLAKLGGDPVAITAGGLVPITKPLIVTVTGVVITYFALLYELR